ncbi:hypothetical protein M2459_003174 [Parabacteroides sp. PF5-5]|nr:hypothetical protein [Parabacteroides sp. PH5-39]MDH6317398.1 hypothetical protein [Parabacteroides sp. PF5-13]MDH6321161.1 hypothetical protein [Parabacteroides sp. PH5-13]MDH6324893.1 hypothetical protein [Parabacteroides sp. PH5-8]MDH6328583.1 hypothetical protein [Parabacteroides sp. PH5-41]MDH6336404.1 hypothetical protein [Parabacteroides sp. PF5-5]MDH6347468.1 hypothetical protein [Parabacteroides sp. PH5-46]MDH6362411.1 hypothetical protein [Parabacteroides sp. PH5-16]MDH6378098.
MLKNCMHAILETHACNLKNARVQFIKRTRAIFFR